MGRGTPVFVLLLFAASAAVATDQTDRTGREPQADALRKCVAADGSVSYQDQPCDDSAAQVWQRAIDHTEPLTPQQRRAHQARIDADAAALARMAGRIQSGARRHARRPTSTRPPQDACAAARSARRGELERVGFARTVDLLRRLDRDVARACSG